MTAAEMLFERNAVYFDPVTYLKAGDFSSALKSAKINVTQPENYKYGAAGVLVSASKRVPLLRIAARPVDRFIKSMTGGRWGL